MGVQKSRLRLSENFPLKITKAQSFSQTEIKLHPFWLAGDKGAKMTSHGEGRLVGGESTKQGYLPPPTLLSSGKTIFIAGDAWFLSGASFVHNPNWAYTQPCWFYQLAFWNQDLSHKLSWNVLHHVVWSQPVYIICCHNVGAFLLELPYPLLE